MRPALEPGDRLWVLPLRVRPGDIVAVRDPRQPARVLVKRLHAVAGDGRVEVRGDDPAARTDSREFGVLARTAVMGRAVYRYAPRGRTGWLRAGSPRGR